MAECGICLLNPKGFANEACINRPAAQGCRTCKYKCRAEATYIGGINICSGHRFAYIHRIIGNWALLVRRHKVRRVA